MTKQVPMSGKELAALEEARGLMKRGLTAHQGDLARQGLREEPQPWFPGTSAEDLHREWLKSSELFEQEYPELWRACYPRRYEEVGGAQYDSPKTVARAMLDAFIHYHTRLEGDRGVRPGTTEQNEALWASRMAERGVPTYYLSRDLAIALTQTTPAQVLNWSTRELPFEAAAFMLPENLFIHDEYGSVSFIAYVRAMQGVSTRCCHPLPRVKHDLDVMANSFSVFLRTKSGMMLHWTYSADLPMVDLKNDAELEELQKNYSPINPLLLPTSWP